MKDWAVRRPWRGGHETQTGTGTVLETPEAAAAAAAAPGTAPPHPSHHRHRHHDTNNDDDNNSSSAARRPARPPLTAFLPPPAAPLTALPTTTTARPPREPAALRELRAQFLPLYKLAHASRVEVSLTEDGDVAGRWGRRQTLPCDAH